MTFAEELVQLLLIIGALLLALAGINFWTKKGGSITLPSMGGKSANSANPADGMPAGMGADTDESMTDLVSPKSKSSSGNSAADRHGDRFNLTGKDAEAAARVLKRMLKQDSKFKDQSDHQ